MYWFRPVLFPVIKLWRCWEGKNVCPTFFFDFGNFLDHSGLSRVGGFLTTVRVLSMCSIFRRVMKQYYPYKGMCSNFSICSMFRLVMKQYYPFKGMCSNFSIFSMFRRVMNQYYPYKGMCSNFRMCSMFRREMSQYDPYKGMCSNFSICSMFRRVMNQYYPYKGMCSVTTVFALCLGVWWTSIILTKECVLYQTRRNASKLFKWFLLGYTFWIIIMLF